MTNAKEIEGRCGLNADDGVETNEQRSYGGAISVLVTEAVEARRKAKGMTKYEELRKLTSELAEAWRANRMGDVARLMRELDAFNKREGSYVG